MIAGVERISVCSIRGEHLAKPCIRNLLLSMLRFWHYLTAWSSKRKKVAEEIARKEVSHSAQKAKRDQRCAHACND
jgi:hypothetical protein